MSEKNLTVWDNKEVCRSSDIDDEWKGLDFAALVGRVGALRATCKQLPLSTASQKFCVISRVKPTTGRVELFISSSLMFGQTAAV